MRYEGWLKIKRQFSTKDRYFELDEMNDYVTIYSNVPTLGSFTKVSIIGSFSLDNARIEKNDKKKRRSILSNDDIVSVEYRMKIKTAKGKKYVLVAPTIEERDQWVSTFENAKNLAMSSKDLLDQWSKEETCIRCVGKA